MTCYVIWLKRKMDGAETVMLHSSSEPMMDVIETATKGWGECEGKVWTIDHGAPAMTFERGAPALRRTDQ